MLSSLYWKIEIDALDLQQVHIEKTRPNKTPGVSIWQESVQCWGQIMILSSNQIKNQINLPSNDDWKSNGKIIIL